MGMQVRDASLKQTRALKNGAGAASMTAFDLGHGPFGDLLAEFEFKLSAPATGTNLGDTHTVTYIIEHSVDNVTFTTLYDKVIVQTGAGGAGAAAASKTVRLPVDVNRYVRATATNGSAEDLSAASMTAELLF